MFSIVRCSAFRRSASRSASTLPLFDGAEKPSIHGQPMPSSHPHLIKADHLTPAIPPHEYEHRRRALIESLPDNSLVLVAAGPIKYMSQNIFYKYRPSSDFWYLTGFEEPESLLVLKKLPSSSRGYSMTLFASGSDPVKELWDGPRTSHPDIESFFAADSALPISQITRTLKSTLQAAENIYVDLPTPRVRSTSSPRNILKYLTQSDTTLPFTDIIARKSLPLSPLVAKLRAIKSSNEVANMRMAAEISATAHKETMLFTKPGFTEGMVGAHFEYLCALKGAQRPAYVPVVASGPNTRIIHYTANNALLQPGELVLLDAGCEYNGYASDITRTFPVDGQFTDAQEAIYTAVLETQKALIRMCTPASGHSLMSLHAESVKMLEVELKNAGGGAFRDTVWGRMEKVYPHFLSHPIGIDLHESGSYDRNAPLRPNQVITIEPGLYIPPTDRYPKWAHNIGVRIEDEVLIMEGDQEPVVLSVSAPKEVRHVQSACQGF